MANNTLITAYRNLDDAERYMVQICAFSGRGLRRQELVHFYTSSGKKSFAGRRFTQKTMSEITRRLVAANILIRNSSGNVQTTSQVADWVMQDAIRQGEFGELRRIFDGKQNQGSYYSYSFGRTFAICELHSMQARYPSSNRL